MFVHPMAKNTILIHAKISNSPKPRHNCVAYLTKRNVHNILLYQFLIINLRIILSTNANIKRNVSTHTFYFNQKTLFAVPWSLNNLDLIGL